MDELDRRYDTDFLTVQKLIKTNSLGRITDFESHFDRYVPAAPYNLEKQEHIRKRRNL
jgi:predicted dehydrogenase